MSLYRRNHLKPPVGLTEFEILRASHKFLRDDDEVDPEQSQALTTANTDDQSATDITKGPSGDTSSWNDQLAAKYYASLYREFALCDLKHYKSGNFALRWRTEDEVLSGAGETTCGNTRCEHHPSSSSSSFSHPSSSSTSKVTLTTLELPFGYVEHGKSKNALVKVVLCGKCLKKLMWKKNKEKENGKEKEVLKREENSDSEGEREKEKERSGKSKRKREGDINSEEEKYENCPNQRQSQLPEDQSVNECHGTHTPREMKDKDASDSRKRRRSRSRSRSRDSYRLYNEGRHNRHSSSSRYRHRERR